MNDGYLTAVIDEKEEFTVRIPRNAGLEASLCSCKSKRCVHRALAVLLEEGALREEDIEKQHHTTRRKNAIPRIET